MYYDVKLHRPYTPLERDIKWIILNRYATRWPKKSQEIFIPNSYQNLKVFPNRQLFKLLTVKITLSLWPELDCKLAAIINHTPIVELFACFSLTYISFSFNESDVVWLLFVMHFCELLSESLWQPSRRQCLKICAVNPVFKCSSPFPFPSLC